MLDEDHERIVARGCDTARTGVLSRYFVARAAPGCVDFHQSAAIRDAAVDEHEIASTPRL